MRTVNNVAESGGAFSAQQIRHALEVTKQQWPLQTDLPLLKETPPAPIPEPNRLLEYLIRFLKALYDAREGITFVGYALIALLLLLLLFVFVHRVRRTRLSSAKEYSLKQQAVSPNAPTADWVRMQQIGTNADWLASQGLYVEAMHVLLLESIAQMRRQLHSPIADSLTSREVLAAAPLSTEARNALAGIVARVEISYYGTYEPQRHDFDFCRSSYQTLLQLLGERVLS